MHTILLIDDDVAVRSTMRKVLERADYEVVTADNGREAIALLDHTIPDLVITDILMPEMDGIEVITTLYDRAPDLPVIAVSGGGRLPKELVLGTAGVLGAVHTMSKPFDNEELLDKIAEILGGP